MIMNRATRAVNFVKTIALIPSRRALNVSISLRVERKDPQASTYFLNSHEPTEHDEQGKHDHLRFVFVWYRGSIAMSIVTSKKLETVLQCFEGVRS